MFWHRVATEGKGQDTVMCCDESNERVCPLFISSVFPCYENMSLKKGKYPPHSHGAVLATCKIKNAFDDLTFALFCTKNRARHTHRAHTSSIRPLQQTIPEWCLKERSEVWSCPDCHETRLRWMQWTGEETCELIQQSTASPRRGLA